MYRNIYQPPVVRRGAHPIREYGNAPYQLAVVGPPGSSGNYTDTGGYAWSYSARTGAIRMLASPVEGQPVWQFDKSHSQWQRIYDAVIAGQTPVRYDEAVGVAKYQGGKSAQMPQRQYATCGTVTYGVAAPSLKDSDFQRAPDPFDLTGSKAAVSKASSSLLGVELTPANIALGALALLGIVSLVRRPPAA